MVKYFRLLDLTVIFVDIMPTQILSTRKRKDANEADIKVQVCVFAFDLLYLNEQPLVKSPLADRRELLRKHFNEVEGMGLLEYTASLLFRPIMAPSHNNTVLVNDVNAFQASGSSLRARTAPP